MADYFVSGYFPDRYWPVTYFQGDSQPAGFISGQAHGLAVATGTLTAAAQAVERPAAGGGGSRRRGGWRPIGDVKPYKPARLKGVARGAAQAKASLSAMAWLEGLAKGGSTVTGSLAAADRNEEWNRFWLLAA